MRWADESANAAQTLTEAQRLQEEASKLGFDWPSIGPLWDKLAEELDEFREAVASGDKADIQDEMGDMLFMLVNFSRFLNVSPQQALHGTNQKFIRRLSHVEKQLAAAGKSWADADLDEMERYWQAAKTVPIEP